ncbi:meso-butanediol dehydrogenase/(S,S)-butanediol dehydrogenase/diacetyl reductase [Erwinia persicina]|jgi:meso-butanediol dehydrogenase/(S,S)-butanediol dehydrogenase/diacetyl reductase|uniref:SDR family NAD(P)-dependent oxidoreductase n=2 Tax=Erwinia TaxID=551 RepID=A0ABV4EAN6_9GAMM|nr:MULTISPECIES: SDR family oxidoreductase [Erwinia]MCP1437279.1 meso-butanediol dehydrogenase/(S,S)-butanediol dehydrogenase/diacetyl reductase [Erwinia persicina]MDN4627160.1 SDR family NAD(P)-dependent oxidoreductase [Erwinia sp. PsM31]MDN8540646.1 SDR family oxidoreductase [Erwinia sp. BC051422]
MARFQQKVVVVTGAGSGIGQAAAERFASEGASVVLVGRTKEKLDKTLAKLAQGEHLVATCDVGEAEQVERLAKNVLDKYGRVDVLVNNAGQIVQGRIHEIALDDWKQLMKVDLDGVFYCVHYFMPALLKSKGNVVNVSSVSGLGGDWGMSVYNAAKGAVTNFTRSLALDYGEDGVRVNAICPGFTFTDLTEEMKDNQQLLNKFYERIPLARAGEPEDIASAIAFIASDDARYITGVNLPVDGGIMASNGQPKQA